MKNRVLLVEDDCARISALAEILRAVDVELEIVRDPERAVALLERAQPPFDLLILDRRQAGLDGSGLLQRLRQDPRLCRLPVVMQCCSQARHGQNQGPQEQATYCLSQVREAGRLVPLVEAALRRAESTRALEAQVGVRTIPGRLLKEATFEFRTVHEARELASVLACVCPKPERASIGLLELMVNAIEHGNLEISYSEKAELCRRGDWEAELTRRAELGPFSARVARVQVVRDVRAVRFVVQDEGPGFHYGDYLEFSPARSQDPNGRGIALARAFAFSDVFYRSPGNVVVAEVKLDGTP